MFMRHAFSFSWVFGIKDCSAYIKTMKYIFYTCECMRGVQDVDCEIVMLAGVGRDISVL